MKANLDLLEEIRDFSQVHMANYHKKVERYYNHKAKPKDLYQGD